MLRSFYSPTWRLVVLATALAFSPVTRAQEVRLTSLLQLAMVQHPTILQSRSQSQAAGYDLAAAKWGRFPTLSSEMRSDSTYTQSIARLEQPLWSGGRIDGRVEQGEANVRAANAAVGEAELNALTQVGSAFFEVLRLTSRLEIGRAHV